MSLGLTKNLSLSLSLSLYFSFTFKTELRRVKLRIYSVNLFQEIERGGGGTRKPTYESEGGTRRVVPREAVLSERLNKDGIYLYY